MKTVRYGVLLLWGYLAIYYFYQIFIRCFQINDNCWSLFDYMLIFPLTSLIAYGSIQGMRTVKKSIFRKLIEPVIILIIAICFPWITNTISINLKSILGWNKEFTAPITAIILGIVIFVFWYILDKNWSKKDLRT